MAKMASSTYFSCWKRNEHIQRWKKKSEETSQTTRFIMTNRLEIAWNARIHLYLWYFLNFLCVFMLFVLVCVVGVSPFPLCFNVTLTHTQVVISHLFWLRKIHMRAIIASLHRKKLIIYFNFTVWVYVSETAWAAATLYRLCFYFEFIFNFVNKFKLKEKFST